MEKESDCEQKRTELMTKIDININRLYEENNKIVNFIVGNLKLPYESLRLIQISEDIFHDSLILLRQKYYYIDNFIDIRKILYGILKIKIKEFRRKEASKSFYDNFNNEEGEQSFSDTQLVSPEVIYQRQYYQKTKANRNKTQREYYKKHRTKFLLKEKNPTRMARKRRNSKLWLEKLKSNPKKYREYRLNKNAKQRIRYYEAKKRNNK